MIGSVGPVYYTMKTGPTDPNTIQGLIALNCNITGKETAKEKRHIFHLFSVIGQHDVSREQGNFVNFADCNGCLCSLQIHYITCITLHYINNSKDS